MRTKRAARAAPDPALLGDTEIAPTGHRLPRNTARVTLVRESWDAPAELAFGDATLVPLRAGEKLAWRLR